MQDLLASGQAPPCGRDPEAWFHPYQVVRDMAARKCLSLCPLVEACGRAGEHETDGVWGGIDRTTDTRRNHRNKTNPYDSKEEPCHD